MDSATIYFFIFVLERLMQVKATLAMMVAIDP